MKNFFLITFLAAFFMLGSGSVDAQTLGNRTQCDVEMKIQYGWPGCVPVATTTIVVPAFAVIPFPLPPGMVILRAKGTYTTAFCPFFIGVPCTGLPPLDNVACPAACGPYKAHLGPLGDLRLLLTKLNSKCMDTFNKVSID